MNLIKKGLVKCPRKQVQHINLSFDIKIRRIHDDKVYKYLQQQSLLASP